MRTISGFLTLLALLFALPLLLLASSARPAFGGGDPTLIATFSPTTPTLDGLCSDEYAQATPVPVLIPAGPGGFTVTARAQLTATDLFVCVPSLDVSRAVEVYIDRDNDGVLEADDFRARVRFNTPSNEVAINTYDPVKQAFGGPAPEGVEADAALPPGSEFNADHEFRIARSTLGAGRTVGFLLVLPSAINAPAFPPNATPSTPATWATLALPNTITLVQVPAELRQRALRFLEEARATEPGWQSAELSDTAEPLFRPDLQGPAYYEFAVFGSAGPNAAPQQGPVPAGFIVLATGPHDYPITHWNSQGSSLTQQLRAKATGELLTVYKLDTLYYVGEDARGQRIAFIGQEPFKVEGLGAGLPLDGILNWTPEPATSDTGAGDPLSGTLRASGTLTTPAGLSFEPWASWDALKQGYTASYTAFLEALRRDARADWDVEHNLASYGIALRKGESYLLRFLAGGTPSLSGPGLPLVTTAAEGPGALRVTAIDSRPNETVPLSVTISYSGSTSETLRLAIIDEVRQFVDLPVVIGGAASVTPTSLIASKSGPVARRVYAADQDVAVQQAFGPWSFFDAGSELDQRRYRQLEPREAPNPNDCYSGCGATAWAMLFGWADAQAEPGRNPRWSGRTGIYRAGGGRSSSPAVAPRNQDAGVAAMTMEIRGHIGSYCVRPFSDASPTNPWDMGNAWRYLNGRTGTRLSASWIDPIFGNKADDIRRSIISNRTPAVMGTGFFEHYPLAWRYAEQSRRVCRFAIFECIWWDTEHNRHFFVNQGWGGEGDGWVGYKSWFVGEISP